MAHLLERMFYSATMDGGVPWHGLGVKVDGNLASAAALETAGLNWTVEMQRVYIRDMRAAAAGMREAIEIPGARATVRSDTSAPLGLVTEKYEPIQNAELFRTFADAVGDAAVWHTAGALRGGAEVWALAEIPGDWKIAGGDQRRFVLATAGHDGDHTARWLPTNVTVVCNNTLRAALGGAGKKDGYTVRHLGNTRDALATVTAGFAETFREFDAFKERMETLATVALSPAREREILELVLVNGRTDDAGRPVALGSRDTAALERILDLETHGKGADTWHGTAYGLLQATADYVDHERLQDSSAERRFTYQTAGAGSRLKARMEATLVRELTALEAGRGALPPAMPPADGGGLLDSILAAVA